ncbi:unannotated protein [freshwater metagenome]|uniref:Unannotated protein n=1 Tax=freshwater metagenome TaxID=449393 RepID=A0A6J7HR16_9ZZZZ
MIRRLGIELCGARIDGLVGGYDTRGDAGRAYLSLGEIPQVRELTVAEAEALRATPGARGHPGEPDLEQRDALLAEHRNLIEEPRVDLGGRVDVVDADATPQQCLELRSAIWGANRRAAEELGGVELVELALGGVAVEPESTRLERAERLLDGFGEGTPDRHDLAHGLHLGSQHAAGTGELLEGPTRHLGHDVVHGGLEARRRLLGDVVRDLVERVADGEACRDLRDGKACGLRRQRRATRHTRVHLDDDLRAGLGIDRELHVGATGLDPHAADARERGVAHLLVFDVGQSLHRSDRDGIARMHAHRVKVLDRADDHAVVGAVTHDLELVFFPARDGLLDQDLGDGARIETTLREIEQFLGGGRDACSETAEDVRRADHHREPDAVRHLD